MLTLHIEARFSQLIKSINNKVLNVTLDKVVVVYGHHGGLLTCSEFDLHVVLLPNSCLSSRCRRMTNVYLVHCTFFLLNVKLVLIIIVGNMRDGIT